MAGISDYIKKIVEEVICMRLLTQVKLDCISFFPPGNLAPVLPEITEPLWIFIVVFLVFIREGVSTEVK